MAQRILSQSSGDLILNGSGNGTYTIPATQNGSYLMIWMVGTDIVPTISTSDGVFSVFGFDMGEFSDRHTQLGIRGASSRGLTSISIAGAAPSATIGILYIEVAGIVAIDAGGVPGAWVSTAGGEWSAGGVNPSSSGWTAMVLGLVFGENSGDILTATHGYRTIIQFTTAIGFTLAFEIIEIASTVVATTYTATGTTRIGGANGAELLFRTSGLIEPILWARSSL